MTILRRAWLNSCDLNEPAIKFKRGRQARLEEVRYAVRHKRPEGFNTGFATVFVSDKITSRFQGRLSPVNTRKATHRLTGRSRFIGLVGLLFM